MRIVIDTSRLLSAAPEARVYCREIVRHLLLSRNGHVLALAGWPRRGLEPPSSFFAPLPPAALEHLQEGSLFKAEEAEVAREEPALVYSPLGLPNPRALFPRLKRLLPTVGTFFEGPLRAARGLPLRRQARGLMEASRIVTLTRASREYLVHHVAIPENRVWWIPPGVELSGPWFRQETGACSPLEPYVVLTGMPPGMGAAWRVLKAFHRATRGLRQPVELVILGKVSYLARQAARWLGPSRRAHFAGNASAFERARLLASARALVLAGVRNASLISAMEALRWGVPVIAPELEPTMDILGESALYYSPEGGRSFANELERVLYSEALTRVLAQKGVARAQDFPWESAARRLHQLFSETARELVEA